MLNPQDAFTQALTDAQNACNKIETIYINNPDFDFEIKTSSGTSAVNVIIRLATARHLLRHIHTTNRDREHFNFND